MTQRSTGDTLSILRHSMSSMAKTWLTDGTIKDYDDAKYFNLREVDVDNIRDLSEVLTDLENKNTSVVIRGKYVGDRLARDRDGIDFKPGKVRRALDYFGDRPLHTVMFDLDKWQPLVWNPLTNPVEAFDEYIVSELPAEFGGCSYHYQLSGSHGHSRKGETLNGHIWMWSEKAYTGAQWTAYCESLGLSVDRTVFRTVQCLYTAGPVFEDGVDDPLALAGLSRSGLVDGLLGDHLVLEMSDDVMAAAVSEEDGFGTGGGRGAKMRNAADRDPIAQRLNERDMVKSFGRDGAINVVCPFESEHRSGAGAETSTQYFLPNTGGHALGQFKCLHDGCIGRGRGDFLSALGLDPETGVGADEVFDDIRSEDGVGIGSRGLREEMGLPTGGVGGSGGMGGSGGAGGQGGLGGEDGAAGAGGGWVITAAQHLCTDLANANRISRNYGKKLMVVGDVWYTWSGKHWVREDSHLWRDVSTLSKIIKSEESRWRLKASKAPEGSQDRRDKTAVADALKKWGITSEFRSSMLAAIGILQKMLTVSGECVNADVWLLNVNNGTVDLRTGVLREHRPEDHITRLINIDYVPDAKCPNWLAVLAKITLEDQLGPSKPQVRFLKRWFGYCATGSVREHKFLVHYGQGSNGKSTIIDTIAQVMGDYSATAAPGLMISRGNDNHPTEIADLFGKRMVTAHESKAEGNLREDFIKQATGGDKLKARFMRGDFFEWSPTHKLQLLTNHKPTVKGQDNGIWRRILLMPYPADRKSVV